MLWNCLCGPENSHYFAAGHPEGTLIKPFLIIIETF